jgi:hypothetical protein
MQRGGSIVKKTLAAAVAFASLVFVACSGESPATVGTDPLGAGADGGANATGGGGGGLPCGVDAVLAARCRSCHGAPPKFGAPMPLVTFADLHADAKLTQGKKVYEVVGARIHDDAAPMPQPPNPRLTPAEMATLDEWIAAGAPRSNEACGGSTTNEGGVKPLACAPDQKIRPASKFAMTNAQDLYVCYGFDTSATTRRHVVAGAPHIDNPKIVHHVLLYQADATVSGTPQPCGAGGARGWRLVTGWAPGGKNFELPPEAGFAEEAGTTHWAVQIHYNNAQGLVGEVDESGYDLCSTDQLRPNDADILATGTVQIDIPPRSTFTTTCDLAYPQSYGNIRVISAWAHMHRLGRAEYAKRIRGGQETTILDVPSYDFSVGAGATDVNVDLTPGDTIRTMCKWRNDGDTAVRFGEGTSDEMCFAFLTYYPKITTTGFRWSSPSSPLVSRCTTTTE